MTALVQELRGPWAIMPEALRALAEQTRSLMAKDAKPVENAANVSLRGDVAIMHVKGPLARYRSWATDFLGTSSYGELRKDLQRVVENPAARALLVVVDSPGGECNGCAELADAFYAVRSKMPTAVYVSGTGASAAYFIASAVGKIYCAPTAMLGSIGVIATLCDDTKALAEAGLRTFEIVSSQSPNKSQQPADDSYRGRVQQQIDDLADVFIARVARFRGVRSSTVIDRYGQGDAMVGKRAVDAGLADAISDEESVIAELQKQVSQGTRSPFAAAFNNTAKAATSGKEITMSKLEKRARKLNMSTSEPALVDAAWRARRQTKKAAAATVDVAQKSARWEARRIAAGLPSSASKSEIRAALGIEAKKKDGEKNGKPKKAKKRESMVPVPPAPAKQRLAAIAQLTGCSEKEVAAAATSRTTDEYARRLRGVA